MNRLIYAAFLAELEKIAAISPGGLARVLKSGAKPIAKEVGAPVVKAVGRMDIPGATSQRATNMAALLQKRMIGAPAKSLAAVPGTATMLKAASV